MSFLDQSIAAMAEPLPAWASNCVVVFRYDKIGDLIVTSPLFGAIKAKDPGAFIILVCSPYNRSVLEHMPEVGRIVVYDPKAPWLERAKFALALRRLRPNVTFVMSPSSGGHWMGWLSGASTRGGVIMSYRRLQCFLAPLLLNAWEIVDRQVFIDKPDRKYHLSDIALKLATRCGFPRPACVAQSVPVGDTTRAWAATVATGPAYPVTRILLHLGATWQHCGLSEDGVVNLAERLTNAFPNTTLLMTAGPNEQSYCDAMSATFRSFADDGASIPLPGNAHPRALLFSGLSISAWSALIESATMVITPDTGAVHMASAHQRPVVAVYAPDRYNSMTSLFGPWETPYKTLRGGGPVDALIDEICTAVQVLLEVPAETSRANLS